MALHFNKLAIVNQSHQRTRLRPRDITGAAATNVAWTVGRSFVWGGAGGGTQSVGASFTLSTDPRELQLLLDRGFINIAA